MIDDALIGLVMPMLIDIVNRNIWDSRWRYVISIVFCLLVGTITNLKELRLDSVLASGAIVFASAQTVYKMYWANSTARVKVLNA